ncbi:hypothetical protein BDA96_10G297100, partial [Sorghum bicolor]
ASRKQAQPNATSRACTPHRCPVPIHCRPAATCMVWFPAGLTPLQEANTRPACPKPSLLYCILHAQISTLMFLTNKKEGKNSREQCAGVAVVAFLSGIHLS